MFGLNGANKTNNNNNNNMQLALKTCAMVFALSYVEKSLYQNWSLSSTSGLTQAKYGFSKFYQNKLRNKRAGDDVRNL